MTRKHPTKPGLYWATFDDGDGNVEVAVVRVEYYSGLSSFEDGAVCHFADARDGDRQFEVKNFEPQVVQPWHTIYLGIRTGSRHEEVLVTWHGPVKPPASALKQMPETGVG
ncbi:hypothetical protein [Aquamicrobium sp. LC103]|uniref:hypothetical protein n=1 Tax=Aquamicrobium sp. LC103 TaxID=1120658 RepID=UPI00063EA07F|nr:hypothetical protein [Aquamicrobium sp. LC103]TKT79991.1 hypothetical protein XW59_006415 [Aquamicrobium sp. LC103]